MNQIDCENMNEYIDKKIYSIIKKTPPMGNPNIKTTLVLSGGGIKGFAHIGALKALNENNILSNINTIAGSSVGALIGFLYNIGFSIDEITEFVMEFDFSKLQLVDPFSFLTKYGLNDGEKFIIVIENMMKEKQIDKNITFKELYAKTHITLIITASCINNKEIYYLSHKTFPSMKLVTALRMSISIPIYLVPVIYENKMFVDGGCMDNYPIHLFKDNLNCTIGIYIKDTNQYVNTISNAEEFFINLFGCLSEGNVTNSIKGFEPYTIKINVQNISMIKFNITSKIKKDIFDSGYITGIKYLTENKLLRI